MAKAVTAHMLKTRLGGILRELRQNERFVIFRRNLPVAVLLNIRDYAKEHQDEYEDVEDFLDTMLEEADPEFQRTLKRRAQEVRRGRYLTHRELKLALANKKLR